MLNFIKPTTAIKDDILSFMDSFYAAGETVVNGCGGLDFYKDFDHWLAYLGRVERGEEEGFVPSRIWFAADEAGQLVGVVDLRPQLPAAKLAFGHLGYSVAPPFRRQGHATAMARWATGRLVQAGVSPVRACCYEANEPSRKTLEKTGYTLVGSYLEPESDKNVLIYEH